MPIQPYRSMSDSVSSGAIEHNLGKNSLINSLFQPTLRLISKHGAKITNAITMKSLFMVKIPKKLKNHFNLMSFVLNTDVVVCSFNLTFLIYSNVSINVKW